MCYEREIEQSSKLTQILLQSSLFWKLGNICMMWTEVHFRTFSGKVGIHFQSFLPQLWPHEDHLHYIKIIILLLINIIREKYIT